MDVQKIRGDFPILKNTGVVYFDNAAMTLKPRQVVEKTAEYYEHYCANVHRGAHRLSIKASEEYDRAHKIVGDFIGAKSDEVAMTANTTHSLNILAQSVQWSRLGGKIVISNLEHHSNILPWIIASRQNNMKLEVVNAKKDGSFDLLEWEKASEGAAVVSVAAVSNVFGNKAPVSEISKIAKKAGALFCVDAAAAVGHMEFDVGKIGCDFAAFSSQKGLLGPTGSGVLYISKKRFDILEPKLLGGGTIDDADFSSYKLAKMPDMLEAGTPNIASVLGLAEGVRYVEKIGIKNIERHIESIVAHILPQMRKISGVEIYGPLEAEKKAGIISFNIKGADPHEAALMLDETDKIAVRSGQHCAYPLHKFLNVGGSVRASFAVYNTIEESGIFLKSLSKIAKIFA